MRTTHTRFREVRFRTERTGKCEVCGRLANRTKVFWQTLNPFNKNAQGEAKSYTEILEELRQEARTWEAQPVLHQKCERKT